MRHRPRREADSHGSLLPTDTGTGTDNFVKKRRRLTAGAFYVLMFCLPGRLEFQDQVQTKCPLVLLGVLVERLELVGQGPVIPNFRANQ
jgi:hypothetical protein